MNQTGDTKLFLVKGTPPATLRPAYVWRFWDGSVSVTAVTSGSVLKRLNVGGNPAEGGSPPYVVPFRCDICNDTGSVVQVVTGSVGVNNPPTVYEPPVAFPNNQPFPFDTHLQVKAYDMENAGITFLWYQGTHALHASTGVFGPVTVAGTYAGTVTGVSCSLYTGTLSTTVYGSGTVLTCKVVDGNAGTTLVDFPLQGFDPSSPQFSVAVEPSGVTVDASTQASAVIAPGQVVKFVAHGYDPTPGQLVFTWALYGTNGWTDPAAPFLSNGVTAIQQRGYRNDFVHPISAEVGNGQRVAVVTMTNPTTALSVSAQIPVQLTSNAAPVLDSIGIYDAVSGAALTSVTQNASPARTVVRFSGTAADVDADLLTYKWEITAPVAPTAYTLWGRDIYLDVTDFPAPTTQTTLGVLTAFDRFGAASNVLTIPQLGIVASGS